MLKNLFTLAAVASLAAGTATGQFTYFVDASSTATSPDGKTVATAFTSIQDAIDAGTSFPGFDYTINILPGTYTEGSADIQLPDRGFSLEAYGDTRPVVESRILINSLGALTGFQNQRFSRVLNLELQRVLTIDPADNLQPSEIPSGTESAVEVRGCLINPQAVNPLQSGYPDAHGIYIGSRAGMTSRHVVESCTFTGPGPGFNTNAIDEVASGPASNILRANRISDFRAGIVIYSDTQPDDVTTQVVSNAIDRCQSAIDAVDASPAVVNNSINEFVDWDPATNESVAPVLLANAGSAFVVANNVIWFVVTSGDTKLGDIVVPAGTGTVSTNYTAALPGATNPYVPGRFPNLIGSATFGTGGANLSLAGDLSFVTPLGATGGVPIDISGDMRTSFYDEPGLSTPPSATVAVGADQVIRVGQKDSNGPRLSIPAGQSSVDVFGSIYDTDTTSDIVTNAFQVELRNIPAGSSSVYLQLVTVADPVYYHGFASSFGSFTTDTANKILDWTVTPSGTTHSFTVPGFNLSGTFIEADYYLQAIVTGPNGETYISSRQRIEMSSTWVW